MEITKLNDDAIEVSETFKRTIKKEEILREIDMIGVQISGLTKRKEDLTKLLENFE
jgi:hypothetical protein